MNDDENVCSRINTSHCRLLLYINVWMRQSFLEITTYNFEFIYYAYYINGT